MQINGDAARVARREGKDESIEYTLDGDTFTFPVEYPVSASDLAQTSIDEAWSDNRYTQEMLKHLLGDEQWDRLRGKGLFVADLRFLWRELMTAYGVSSGESPSSPDSSAPGGESSKPNSSASTASTPEASSPAEPAVRAVS